MSQQSEKLKTLLGELYQLDQPNLGIGLYRVMQFRLGGVNQFVHQRLYSTT